MSNDRALFVNGRFFQDQESKGTNVVFLDWLLVENGLIKATGRTNDDAYKAIIIAKDAAIQVHDLGNRIVLPSFIDGHVHFLLLGQSLQKLDLFNCTSLEEIQRKIKEFAQAHPEKPRIMGKGWMRSMVNSQPDASMLDDLDPRPIFLDSKDLHSTWSSSSALREMGVFSMQDPKGGTIDRDDYGRPCGLLNEAAVTNIVWPHLARVASMHEKKTSLREAISAYTSAGYTGCIDMAMDENSWEALLELRKEEQIPLRLSAYWLIMPLDDHAANASQVERAIALSREYNSQTSPDLRLVGIKLICDGIIDACTAHLTQPYSTNIASPNPIWSPEMIGPVIKRADSAGLQCALHAIGDATVKIAIDAVEQNCTPGKRHRLEHIELTSFEDAQRLGKLGITASIQPVHADPFILRAWKRLLGKDRLERAFAYKDFHEHGATLAIGSDSPTAPHAPLRNLYVATTRRSAHPNGVDDEPVNPNFALGLCESVTAATTGSAYSVFDESRVGSLRPGLFADFVVLDMDWDPRQLLKARIDETWFAGRKVYDARA